MLEATELTFSYDDNSPVLQSTNISLSPGEIVLLTGPTGCGKSTLARCLSGSLVPELQAKLSGRVMIDGVDSCSMDSAHVARKVALVQQDVESQICTTSVTDEVAFGPENYNVPRSGIQDLVSEALAAVGASHLAERPTYALSGGEKQRVVIASVLACTPSYLILDEPSSSLDPPGIRQLRDVLAGLRRTGLGVLCIEHNIQAMAPIADRVLRMTGGRIIASDANITAPDTTRVYVGNREDSPTLLTASGLSFSYEQIRAVSDVSVTLREGEVVALMGGNGSGKTTLVTLLAGLLTPESGEVSFCGHPANKMGSKDLARRISVVFQNPNHQLFERTVWKDQTLASAVLGIDKDETDDRSNALLLEAGLSLFKQRNPFSLSHGQKRRLNLTSTTYYKPLIYLLDEPFIGQDSEGVDFASRIIMRRAETGGACLVVTHDPVFARKYCTRVIFMEGGRILLDGPVDSVMWRLVEIGMPEYTGQEVHT